jgi:hypothetical protein
MPAIPWREASLQIRGWFASDTIDDSLVPKMSGKKLVIDWLNRSIS